MFQPQFTGTSNFKTLFPNDPLGAAIANQQNRGQQ